MSREEITRERLSARLHYDTETGSFAWRHNGKRAGFVNSKGYREIMIDQVNYKAHRLAWLWHYGSYPKGGVGMINGERDDIRVGNLKEGRNHNIKRRQILQWEAGVRNTASGRKGVCKTRNKWRAVVTIRKQRFNLGHFESIQKAGEAYDDVARKIQGNHFPSAVRRGALRSAAGSPIIQTALAAKAIHDYARNPESED